MSFLTLDQTIDRGLETLYTLICSLSLPYSTMYIASNILQKAYLMPDVQKRFKDRKYYDVAVGSLYIALKLEEYKVNNDEIINVINRKAKKSEDLLIRQGSSEYSRWKRIILYMEPYLLHQLNFKLDLNDPFGVLSTLRRKYNLSFSMFLLTHSILGDSCHVDICCRIDAKTLVATCLYFAGCIYGFDPFDKLTDQFWGMVELQNHVNIDKVAATGIELIKVYKKRQNLTFEYNSDYQLPALKLKITENDNVMKSSQVEELEELEEGEMQVD